MKNSLSVICLLFLIISCSASKPTKKEELIVIKGSDTMLRLTQKLTDKFSKENPEVHFRVYGGGSKSGINDLLEGKINICTASRNLTVDEAKRLADYYGSVGVYYLIAKDAMSIYVNLENPINNISIDNLAKIFSGKIDDVNQISPKYSGKIKLAIRDLNSGTRKYFSDTILDTLTFAEDAIEFSTTHEIVDFVKNNKYAFGFGGIAWAENVKLLAVDGISPNVKNAKNDSYPLTRYLFFFTQKSSSGNIKNFIDWVLSEKGQKIVQQEGYIPLWEVTY